MLKRDSRRVRAMDGFVARCAASLEAIYSLDTTGQDSQLVFRDCIGEVMRLISVLVAAECIHESKAASGAVLQASDAINDSIQPGADCGTQYESAFSELYNISRLGIFECRSQPLSSEALSAAARVLLGPSSDSSLGSIYFETMPLDWLGNAYQAMLALKPSESGDGLEISRKRRKDNGVYFTPQYLVSYIVESVLGPQTEDVINEISGSRLDDRLSNLRIIDPSMGGAHFLCAAVDYLAERAGGAGRDRFAAECVYGVDVDPLAADISRFCVWAASGYADGIGDAINAHLICANALASLDGDKWSTLFPDAFAGDRGGFDAVVGNPPYIASKNTPGMNGGASPKGQSDSYLLFLEEATDGGLVRPGGMLSMVLPDPMLVRGNATDIRRKLAQDWTITSLLHLPGAFSEAHVANVVPVCKNRKSEGYEFQASRVERAEDRYSFAKRPIQTARELAYPVRINSVIAQGRCEIMYLLENGPFGDIIRRIHGENASLKHFEPPFAPLKKLNAKAIYRGEEIGKSAITLEYGDYPMLLGGQSVHPYEVKWEGRMINASAVQKDIARYVGTKIIVQKSSSKLIAALDKVDGDHRGFVFPQSVYGIELNEPGMREEYLLCLLNSQVMNEYLWRTTTGYKFIHPQIEIEDIKALPIRKIEFLTPPDARAELKQQGIAIFESESQLSASGANFARLGNFITECLMSTPERCDVVHDILVYLATLVTDLTAKSKTSPTAEATRTLESARAAIEAIVWRLYASDPSQMALPM